MRAPLTSATRGSRAATPRFTVCSSTAMRSSSSSAAGSPHSTHCARLGERHGAELVDHGDATGPVLAEDAVVVVARDDAELVLVHPERDRGRAQLRRLVDRGAQRGAALERDGAGGDRAQQPAARARTRSRRARSAAPRRRRRTRARPRGRARVAPSAPTPWRTTSARTSDSAAPIEERISGCSGRTHGRPSRRATSGASAVPAPPSATTGTSGPKPCACAASATAPAIFSTAAAISMRAASSGLRLSRRPSGAKPARRPPGRVAALDEAERVGRAGRGQREALPDGVDDDRVLLGIARARRDELELGAGEVARARRSTRTAARRRGRCAVRPPAAAAGAGGPSTRPPRRRPRSRRSGGGGRPITRSVAARCDRA